MNATKIYKKKIDEYLRKNLRRQKPEILSRALRYSTIDGGKRIRPILCIAGFKACGGGGEYILPVACAIELVHTFSLIHDDLPCMDNDDFRRGKPTSHKVFGEDIAVLAGDALLTMAFDWIADAPNVSSQKKISVTKELSYCTERLISGQVLDLRTPKKKLSEKTIKSIYMKKTSALITTAVRIGAIAAGATKKKIMALTKYGENLGLAFQVVDDLLDMDEDKDTSYARLFGKEKALKYSNRLIDQAVNSLKPFGSNAKLLEDIARLVISQAPKTLTSTFLDRGPSNSAK